MELQTTESKDFSRFDLRASKTLLRLTRVGIPIMRFFRQYASDEYETK
jgi:hypothetical protein